jgi:phage terminase large subunit
MTGPIEYIAPYEPLPWQVEPWRCTDSVMLLTGSAGGGKSRLAAEKLHGFCKRYPGATALALRKTRQSMTNSTVLFMDREVIGRDPSVELVASKYRWEYKNGSILAYGGMADDEQREQIRSIGQKGGADIVWMEEANAFTEDDFNEVKARVRGRAASWRQVILSTNPDAPNHWINRRLIQGKEATVFYSRAADNSFNPPDYLATLESLTGVLKKRLADGLWVAAEGMYFTEWDEERHIVPAFEIPQDWTRWTSTDYGFADPWCTLWFARNPADKHHIYVYREAYSAGLRDEQQADKIVEASKGERISVHVGDPSMFNNRTEQNKPSIASVYHQHGVPLVPGVNSRIAGWQTVRRALAWKGEDGEEKKPRLQVLDGRAPNLVRTLPSMVHDPLDSEDLADKVKGVKTEDHPADTLRYGLMLEAMPTRQMARMADFRVEAD